MHAALSLLVAIALSTAPTAAQALDDRFREMGTIEVTIDGEPMSLLVLWDTKRGRGYATSREVVGRQTINVLGSAINENGKPATPRLNISLIVLDEEPELISAELFDGQGSSSPLVVRPGIGAGGFTAFTLDGERITGSFEAKMRRVQGHTTGDPKVVEDAEPVVVTGDIKVSLGQPQ